MSKLRSLPGLPLPIARSLARAVANLPLHQVEENAGLHHELLLPATSGLPAVPDDELLVHQAAITSLASKAGYPGQPIPGSLRNMDIDLGRYLYTELQAAHTDLLKAETWAWIGTVLLPHVIRWRFPKGQVARYAGPLARHALGRMWLAASALDRHPHQERWDYLEAASADFLVQLLERTSLSSDRNISLAIARTWHHWHSTGVNVDVEALNRNALKRLVFQLSTIEASSLDAHELQKFINDAFTAAASAQADH